jgi:S1-C subfamily serine protease
VESGGQDYTDFLQTDAAINPGNSGGALLTVNGDLIGFNTQIDARGQNLGFAIPVARVRKAFDELVRFGEVREVWLGMEVESLDLYDESVARKLGVPGGKGMLVRLVHPDAPAAEAGLEAGDVILDMASERVRDEAEYHTEVARLKVGQRVAVTAWRGGEKRTLTLTAASFPIERGADLLWQHLGLAVEPAAGRGGGRYVMISRVRPGSAPASVGLRPGFALLAVDGAKVDAPEDVFRALPRGLSRRSMLLVISDGRGTYRVPLPVS